MLLHPAILVCCLLACAATGLHASDPAGRTGRLDHFESRIRPLLEEHCLSCHGGKKQEGGLRLDSPAGWQKGGDSGPALVPGHPEKSLLVRAVSYTDKDLQMPPKKRLHPAQVADLEAWIARGAEDPRADAPQRFNALDMEAGRQWWSLLPVRKPVPPRAGEDSWSKSAVDRFVFERLREAGLQPSPPADRRTLLRRASLGLTGLPPTAAEVEAFERDPYPNAFEKVVERLLASPHYGEHWARHWLDLARYSDTKGYVYGREEKLQVHSWVYRDWVAAALAQDLPYDRFLQLQIAADQLVPANSPDLAAMGFLTLGRRFLGVTHDIIDDRIDVVMRTTQGLSVGCARCHDHKFDPIPTADYYALYGIFQSSAEKLVPCGRDESLHPAFEAELQTREVALREIVASARREREGQLRRGAKDYLLAQLELHKYPEETFTQILGAGDIHPLNVRRWERYLAGTKGHTHPVFLPWHRFAALDPSRFQEDAPSVLAQLQALPAGALHPEVARAFLTPPVHMREVAERYGQLLAGAESRAALEAKHPAGAGVLRDALHAVLYGPDSPCLIPDEDLVNIEWFFPTALVVGLWKRQGDLERHILKAPERVPFANILVDRSEAVLPRIFKRGNPLTKGETVPRRFLQVLNREGAPPFSLGSGRLELARALTSPTNPLTARVMVNRIWMHHFGRGLVGTPGDFGRRGDPPSHPELLDWLAASFMEGGWSVKQVHRHILLSAAYQQSSAAPADSARLRRVLESDPENKLLWRMNPRRLSFEQMRDSWLAATGELDPQVGGKPQDLFSAANLRRSFYGFIDREALPSILRTFDFANPDLSIPRRNDTVVPQQALFTLNHPFLMARARALARKTASILPQADEERVADMYALLFQRVPTPQETAAALALVQGARDSTTGAGAPRKTTVPSAEATSPGAWEELAQMLLICNEFVFTD